MYLQNELAINEENYEKGMQEGMEKGKIEIAKNLLSINLPLEQISIATGLSVDEIKKIKFI